MLIEISVLDTPLYSPLYSIEHIFDSPENEELIKKFSVGKDADGLEIYLKEASATEEKENQTRTYLVKDKITGELACYFSLRTGLVTKHVENGFFDSLSAVELSNFAVNQNYKANHPDISKIGFYVFNKFILPIVNSISKFIGVSTLYIYALPEEKLIEHYKKMGFSRLPLKQEKFVHNHVKPMYDKGCIFMYQNL